MKFRRHFKTKMKNNGKSQINGRQNFISKSSQSSVLFSKENPFFAPNTNGASNVAFIHTNKQAVETAEKLNARAFTYKNHIFFNSNEYQPYSQEGKKLLAHELTHVAQQRSKPAQIQRKMKLPF